MTFVARSASVLMGKMGTARFDTTAAFSRYKADAVLRCRYCKREVPLTAAHMRQLFPMPVTLTEARKRLTCSHCGAREPKIAPVPMMGR